MEHCDLAIIGAGAAGLTAALFAGEAAQSFPSRPRILLLEGQPHPGVKILASGGGRCNVTNERITPEDFNGGSQPIIRNILRSFNEQTTLAWFARLGVPLRLEETGKYFPESNRARTVVDALLCRVNEVGVELRTGVRVTGLRPRLSSDVTGGEAGFEIKIRRSLSTSQSDLGSNIDHDRDHEQTEALYARRVILATGGLALPRSGSDGTGLAMARRLGHAIIPTTPALCPLILASGSEPGGRFAELSGLSLMARLGIYEPSGRRLIERTGSLLFTHFGISGPVALDISRHWLRARLETPDLPLTLAMGHPDFADPEAADAWLREQATRHPRSTPAHLLAQIFPERLARIIATPPPPAPESPNEPASRPALRRRIRRQEGELSGRGRK